MKKTIYYETTFTKNEGIVLKLGQRPGLVETYCVARLASNKKIGNKKFDGFYFNSELKKVD